MLDLVNTIITKETNAAGKEATLARVTYLVVIIIAYFKLRGQLKADTEAKVVKFTAASQFEVITSLLLKQDLLESERKLLLD